MNAPKYADKAILPAIKKIEKFIVASKGLRDMSVYPAFLQSLDKVIAPKTMRNITDAILDFVSFIVEKYGNEGPSRNRLMKPESIRAALLSYRTAFARSSKERQKTQTWIDFCNMPTVDQLKEAKEKIIDFVQSLLKKSEKSGALISVQYQQLMKSLIALIVFRNACRVSSAIYIQHQHYNQLARQSVEDNYSMPLAPAKLNQQIEQLVFPQSSI